MPTSCICRHESLNYSCMKRLFKYILLPLLSLSFMDEITSLSPNYGMQRTNNLNVNLVASGINFYDEYTWVNGVYFSGNGIDVNGYNVISSNTVQVNINIDDTDIGYRNVYLNYEEDWSSYQISESDAFEIVENPAEIISVYPEQIQQGEIIQTIEVFGSQTYWNSSSQVTINNDFVDIEDLLVYNNEYLTFKLAADQWAYTGYYDIKVITGNTYDISESAIQILSGDPINIESINPSTVYTGTNNQILEINVDGANFLDPYASRNIYFSCSDIDIQSNTPLSDESLELIVDLYPWAEQGEACNLTVGINGPNGGEWQYDTQYNALNIQGSDHSLTSISPDFVYRNSSNQIIDLYGENTNWLLESVNLAISGNGIHVDWVDVVGSNHIQAQIDVYSYASTNDRNIVIESGNQLNGLQNALNVRGAEIISLIPNEGMQGTNNLEVTLIAGGVNFYDEYTYINNITFSGNGISANNYTVSSQNSIDFLLDIENSADLGLRDVELNYEQWWDNLQLNKLDAFEVVGDSFLGDLNFDSNIDILDILILVSCIIDGNCTSNSDLNEDGNNDILDIIALVHIVLDY